MYAVKALATFLLAVATAAYVGGKAIPAWDGEDFVSSVDYSSFPATITEATPYPTATGFRA